MKILLDTNVILRFILKDHDTMSPAARDLISKAASGEVQLLLDSVIIAECCFVLSGRVYAFSKSDIASVISKMITLKGVIVDDARRINDALELFSKHNVDFADAYLAAAAKIEDLFIASFDRDFSKLGVSVYGL